MNLAQEPEGPCLLGPRILLAAAGVVLPEDNEVSLLTQGVLVPAAVLGQESWAVAFRARGQWGALPGCSVCELGHSS